MRHLVKPFLLLGCLLALGWLAACSMFPPAPLATAARPAGPTPAQMVASIRAAGARENSVIAVNPLRDPGVAVLRDEARRNELAGHYVEAGNELDQALKLNPDAPDLLQDRAEIAVRLRHFATAERLARRSWSLGPKLGPLCARNWQTIVEMRLQAGDQPGAANARHQVGQCHEAGITRY
ncbi:MAG: tetratricopeptide repeat protein [Rhodanobacter sp.]|nr:MAG: tetratricopeptide repeat protein [Rhodanobacter sp.]